MTLEHAVARATGESLNRVRRTGFSFACPPDVHFDPEPDVRPANCVNWDSLRLRQGIALTVRRD